MTNCVRFFLYRCAYAAYIVVCPLFIFWLRFAPSPETWPIMESALKAEKDLMPQVDLKPPASLVQGDDTYTVSAFPAVIKENMNRNYKTTLFASDLRTKSMPILLGSEDFVKWSLVSDWGKLTGAPDDPPYEANAAGCKEEWSYLVNADECFNAAKALKSELKLNDKDIFPPEDFKDTLMGPKGCFVAEIWLSDFSTKRVLAMNTQERNTTSLKCKSGLLGGPRGKHPKTDCTPKPVACDARFPAGAFGFCECSASVFTKGPDGCFPDVEDPCKACTDSAGGFTCTDACSAVPETEVHLITSLCGKSTEWTLTYKAAAKPKAAAAASPLVWLGEGTHPVSPLVRLGEGRPKFLVACIVAPLSVTDDPTNWPDLKDFPLKPPPFNDRCSGVAGICAESSAHCTSRGLKMRQLLPSGPPAINMNELVQGDLSSPEHTGFWFWAFLVFSILAFLTTAVQQLPGIHGDPNPPERTAFFGRQPQSRPKRDISELGAIVTFSVAAAEHPIIKLRNWLGKVSTNGYMSMPGGRTFPAGGQDALKFGRDGMPRAVDIFLDEADADKVSKDTYLLWDKWVSFLETDPPMGFIVNWAASVEQMTMETIDGNKEDPFAEWRLQASGLTAQQVQEILEQANEYSPPRPESRELEMQQPAAPLNPQPPQPDLGLNRGHMDALKELCSEFHRLWANKRGGSHRATTDPFRGNRDNDYNVNRDDYIFHRHLSLDGSDYEMLYVRRAKPQKKEGALTRNMDVGNFVCLGQKFFRDNRGRIDQIRDGEAGGRSEWELLRTCYAEVHSAAGGMKVVKNCSPDMRRVLENPPAFLAGIQPQGSPEDPDRHFGVPEDQLETYWPARGKAGALNFGVRLLHSRGLLGEDKRSLFGIFDSRHMPYKRFWWWVLPSFFRTEPGGDFALDDKVSFVQVPQNFAQNDVMVDILDVTNGLGFNVINQQRNSCGAVTSCGTNAVWLLPRPQDLPHLSPTGEPDRENNWWKMTFFEEKTKIEDTASSHRLLLEGKHSIYVNPMAEPGLPHERSDQKHPAVVGVAKLGAVYLAAVERWCEGAVQLFWVTMFTERRAWRVWVIAAYCFAVFWLLLIFCIHPPDIICNEDLLPKTAALCTMGVNFYIGHHAEAWHEETYRFLAFRPMTKLVECAIWWIGILPLSCVFFAAFFKCKMRLFVRFVVIFDNLTYWTNAFAAFFWVALTLYLVLGFTSPFTYRLFDLLCWIFVQRVLVWTMLYSKRYASLEQLSLWRSQQAYMVGAPMQVFAMFQGTHAAYQILKKDVDKSFWKDPEGIVSKLGKMWTLIMLSVFPIGLGACAYGFSKCGPTDSQLFALILAFVQFLMVLNPFLVVWGLMGPRLKGCCERRAVCYRKLHCVGASTILVRLLNELVVPLALMVLNPPEYLGFLQKLKPHKIVIDKKCV